MLFPAQNSHSTLVNLLLLSLFLSGSCTCLVLWTCGHAARHGLGNALGERGIACLFMESLAVW
jgi:hypothetical protein